jgi:hypothetical protein
VAFPFAHRQLKLQRVERKRIKRYAVMKKNKKVRSSYLVGVGEGMAINTVVRSVQLTVKEPGSITVVESAVTNSVEGL